ncbi:MAG: hypothetical protein ABIQ41_11370 [Gemmatimonadales bacterium]
MTIDAANYVNFATVTTTNATPATVCGNPLGAGAAVTIVATVVGKETGAAGVGYVIVGTFRNNAGTVAQVGTTTALHTAEDASLAACAVAFAISGTTVNLQVTGIAGKTIDWHGTLTPAPQA